MNDLENKKILFIYQPWIKNSDGLHTPIVENLRKLKMKVDFLNLENPPKFDNQYLPDKLRNIFERKFRKNNHYILLAEKKHHNKFNLKKLKELKKEKNYYDFVLIIKPEEYSDKFIKEAKSLGKVTAGYIWDGIRFFFLKSLYESRNSFDYLYSFDHNDILKYKDLNLSFLSNFYFTEDDKNDFTEKQLELFYVGSNGGRLENQRRDLQILKILKFFPNNTEIKLFLEKAHFLIETERVKHPQIEYITQYISYHETMMKVKNAKIVLDIRKKHHIGLSFRFFECMYYEVKLITDNETVKNYDFYRPENILIVDFDKIDEYQDQIKDFISVPYQKLPPEIFEKYSIKNWVKNIFRIGDYQKIEHLG